MFQLHKKAPNEMEIIFSIPFKLLPCDPLILLW